MGRKYEISTGFQSVSAVQDLMELNAAAGHPVRIWEAHVEKENDIVSEQLMASIETGATTSGSGGSSTLNVGAVNEDAGTTLNAGFERNNTTRANTGTINTRKLQGFNLLSGYHFVATREDECINVAGGGRAVLALLRAPAAARNINARLVVEEM